MPTCHPESIYPSVVAIDGPAASGKSTIGELLARRLGYLYFDTGAMYRAVTWVVLARGVPIGDEAAVTRLSETVEGDYLVHVTPYGDAGLYVAEVGKITSW